MKTPPMPNNPDEENLRILLRGVTSEKDVTEEFKTQFSNLVSRLGTKRLVEIGKEEGLDFVDAVLRQVAMGFQKIGSAAGDEIRKLDALHNSDSSKYVGELLIAHLRLENLIDQILLDNMKQYDDAGVLSRARLSFFQKIQLLPAKNSHFTPAISFLHEINKLRNEFSHNIKFDFEKSKEFKEIEKHIQRDIKMFPDKYSKFERLLRQIKGVEFYLLSQTPNMKDEINKINQELPFLQTVAKNWFNDIKTRFK